MPTGTIKKLVSDRGFGFIAAEDGKEYFFHRTGLDSSINFDSPAGVCLTQEAGGRVHGTVYGDAPVTAVHRQALRILSLDVDGRAWPHVGQRDPAVGRLQQMFPGFRPVNWSNAYEAAAWCLISSRISMRQGQDV